MEDQDGNYGLVNKMNVKDLIDAFLTADRGREIVVKKN